MTTPEIDHDSSPFERLFQIVLGVGVLVILYQLASWLYSSITSERANMAATQQEANFVATISHQTSETPTTVSTLTRTFTPRYTLTGTFTNTPALRYWGAALSYIPDLTSNPNSYSIMSQTPINNPQADEIVVTYESQFPIIYHTDDAYSISYDVMVATDTGIAGDVYNSTDLEYIKTFLSTNYSLYVNPVQIDTIIEGVAESKVFCAYYNGLSGPGITCYVIVRDENLVGIIEIILNNLGNSSQRAIEQSHFFASLLVTKLK